MEKRVELALWVDLYGSLLTDHQLRVLKLHIDEDLTYQEIADQMGITRQGVHDAIKTAGRKLGRYEQTLGMARRYGQIRREVQKCRAHLNQVEASGQSNIALEQAKRALDAIEWIEE